MPSYANFLITNGSIIFPIYGLDTDEEAVKCLEEIVAGRYVVRPVNAHEIALCGGSIHCFTQQVVKSRNVHNARRGRKVPPEPWRRVWNLAF